MCQITSDRKVAFKLTDPDGFTRRGSPGETHWEIGRWEEAKSSCHSIHTDGWRHAYAFQETAHFLNAIYQDDRTPRLWQVELAGEVVEAALRLGARRMRLTEEIFLKPPTMEECIRFAIYLAYSFASESWCDWAKHWLDGTDRTIASAEARLELPSRWKRERGAHSSYWALRAAIEAQRLPLAGARPKEWVVSAAASFVAHSVETDQEVLRRTQLAALPAGTSEVSVKALTTVEIRDLVLRCARAARGDQTCLL